jgi:class 3 adenylate cyclase
MSCRLCGFANATAARFCAGCGKALDAEAGVAFEAERRHVCVLFCDLVGWTAMSRRPDAEDLRNVVGAYQSRCEAVVLQHDGFVAQYRGDSVEVYFGYPRAYEDDASRVVRCAIEILAAMRELTVATKVELQVRIGIDCGHVVVGTLGRHGRSERLAIGLTPNVAARARETAAPGEVVVTEAIWRLLPATFAVEPMGFRELKGVERPVALFRVVVSGGLAAGLNMPQTPFIGHTSERDALEAQWSSVKSGVSRFVILRGEPSIGKSRRFSGCRCSGFLQRGRSSGRLGQPPAQCR